MSKVKINNRAQEILKALVTRYIRDGAPVGSKTIAEESKSSLSAATIRNIMAELEEAGYLHSPHTSSGRIPTERGYRFFVESILQVQTSFNSKIEIAELNDQFNKDASEQEIVESTSNIISHLTHLAGIVTLPRYEQILLRHIEFLPLANNRVLVILVFNEREVHNIIIHTDREYSASELQQSANYIMANFSGMNFQSARKSLLDAMQDDHRNIDSMMKTVFDIAEKNLQQKNDYVIAGEHNLLNMAEETGVSGVKRLFDAFTKKQDILYLLDQCLLSQRIQIFIGKESGYDILDNCSLITAPYFVEGKVLGVLGVIGPTRMDYERVIQAVDVTAKLLGLVLKER